MPFIFGEPPSPEEQERMQREAEEHQMKIEAFTQEVDHWIDELGPRETFILKSILCATVGDEKWTALKVGELNGKMRYKHNVDIDSGKPEGEEFFSMEIRKDE